MNVKVVFSELATNQVNYLLDKISKVEWSGFTIYHTVNEDPNNLVLEVLEVFPYDIGDPAYTEFEVDKLPDDIIEKYMDEGLEVAIGLIHSHNDMGVFFSGTDTKTMEELTKLWKDGFLSIIVNNKRERTGKFGVVEKVEERKNLSLFGKIFSLKNNKEGLNIVDVKEIDFTYPVDKEFADRVNELQEKAKKKHVKNKHVIYHGKHARYNYGKYGDSDVVELNTLEDVFEDVFLTPHQWKTYSRKKK